MDTIKIGNDFKEYGFYLTDELHIGNKNTVSDLYLRAKGQRVQVRAKSDNRLLWSGSDPVEFLKSFWFAEKLNKDLV